MIPFRKTAVLPFLCVGVFVGQLLIPVGKSAANHEDLYGVTSGTSSLYIIDTPASKATTHARPLAHQYNKKLDPIAMAVRPSDGALFIWTKPGRDGKGNGTTSEGELLIADRCTGSYTSLGPKKTQNIDPKALAFGPEGKLYALNESLYEIDTKTGESRSIGSPSSWFYRLWLRVGAADFDPKTGALYGLETRWHGPQRVVKVNTKTGEAAVIGELSRDVGAPVGSMAFTEYGTILASGRRRMMFEMNTTGKIFRGWAFDSAFVAHGLDYAPPCKESKGKL